MSSLFLLVPIGLPLIGGLWILLYKFKSEKLQQTAIQAIAVLTSICVWIALFGTTGKPVDLYSFDQGFSVTFSVDGLGALFAGMVSLMWPLVLLYAYEYMEHAQRKNVFFAFFIMTYGVTLGVALADNMITMYLFYEMLTLVTIPLVSHYENHESMFAGRKYAAYTIGGASLSFLAVVLATIYGESGRFLFGGSVADDAPALLMQIAFFLGFFGFGTKAAIFPLHDWLPTASVAPTPVTALLHAVAVVNSGAFAVMRMVWYVFSAEAMRGTPAQIICLLTAEFTLLFAAIKAIRERHFKRRLAYSTVSNLSYMLYGVMLLTPGGFVGGMAHMVFHSVIKMTLFLCAGAFMHQTGRAYIYEVNGVAKRMPVTFLCYTLGALSLTGIPLFCGFISKWSLLTAGLQEGTVWGVIGVFSLIASAFLCAIYTLSISVRAYFPVVGKDNYPPEDKTKEAGLLMLIPIVAFSVVNILFGVFSEGIMDFFGRIAAGIL